jgi:hypothetical protein
MTFAFFATNLAAFIEPQIHGLLASRWRHEAAMGCGATSQSGQHCSTHRHNCKK